MNQARNKHINELKAIELKLQNAVLATQFAQYIKLAEQTFELEEKLEAIQDATLRIQLKKIIDDNQQQIQWLIQDLDMMKRMLTSVQANRLTQLMFETTVLRALKVKNPSLQQDLNAAQAANVPDNRPKGIFGHIKNVFNHFGSSDVKKREGSIMGFIGSLLGGVFKMIGGLLKNVVGKKHHKDIDEVVQMAPKAFTTILQDDTAKKVDDAKQKFAAATQAAQAALNVTAPAGSPPALTQMYNKFKNDFKPAVHMAEDAYKALAKLGIV